MIQVGQVAQLSKTISEEDVTAFARLVGDLNPVHMEDKYAAKTRFGKRIAHGMWGASLIAVVLLEDVGE